MNKVRVLIVEDEFIIAADMKTSLELKGFEVVDVVGSGEEAISRIQAAPPDILLLDVMLRGPMDGITLAEQIKTTYDIPIIFITAHSDNGTIDRAKAIEPYGYIVKPTNIVELHSMIQIALYKHSMENRLRESEKRYRTLSEELESLNLQLRASNEEYEQLNEDLNASNEELEATNEELVSAQHEMVQSQQVIIDSEHRYRELYNSIPSGVAIYHAKNSGQDFVLVDINRAGLDMTRKRKDAVIGKLVTEAFPGVKDFGLFDVLQEVWKSGKAKIHHTRQYTDDTLNFWAENFVYRLPSGEVVAVFTDLTVQKQAEALVEKSLHEKEILIKEIHHRVKNNLQIISSLLTLQSRYINDEHDREQFNESHNRIYTMALAHEMLYQSPDLSRINLAGYIREITQLLFQSYPLDRTRIALYCEASDINITIEKAIPCALIVNELVSNAVKYAFPGDRAGELTVSVTFSAGEGYQLIVADNGVGLPDNFDGGEKKSLGMRLVHALVDQLQGSMSISRDHGTRFMITFPNEN